MNVHVDVAQSANQAATPSSSVRATVAPPAPVGIADTGLEPGFLVDLLVKTVYRMGLERPSEISRAMKLPIGIVTQLVETAQAQRMMETLGQLGASLTAEMRYALTGKGREWALEALGQSEYFGPAPVTLEAFAEQLTRQSIRNVTLTRSMLDRVFCELTLEPKLMEKLGPAANCAASVLLYGPPGNGKSTIAEAICTAFGGEVYFPYALTVDKQVITVFDPTVHVRAGAGEGGEGRSLRRDGGHDQRFVACKRPAVITGGELTLDRLDLKLNTVSRVYEAPMQLKAAGGVLVIDDFGRQRQSPQELINRLIIPLENGRDYLALETGRKFEIPFDALVVFSTNIAPKKLVDDAALRRLRYKVLVDKPDRDTFIQIFVRTARKFGLRLDENVMLFVLIELYGKTEGAQFAGFHPRFLIDQVKSISAFEGVAPQLRPDFLARAWENLFTSE
ncbi:MAG TPA: AAA family ATPase [Thermohalobaculum sp.]|nr:AAA family ATPase [Thermohalobaculum sp.]